jgi:hypothetical protein
MTLDNIKSNDSYKSKISVKVIELCKRRTGDWVMREGSLRAIAQPVKPGFAQVIAQICTRENES